MRKYGCPYRNGPRPRIYDDPRVAHVYGVMSEHMLSTDIMESCDKSLEITKWMEKFMIHIKPPGNFNKSANDK